MDNNPVISIVIPTYNRGKTINRAIESVLSQTFKEYEIIVIDDGSNDNTRDIIKRHIRKVRYYYQNNSGPSKARNIGIHMAKGEWIAFLDSDDLWFKTKLEIQFEEARKAKCDVCFHDVLFYNLDDCYDKQINMSDNVFIYKDNAWSNISRLRATVLTDAYQRLMKSKQLFLTPTLLVKTNAIKSMGGYLESFQTSEDYELYYRLAIKCKILYLYEKLAVINLDGKRKYNLERIYNDRIEAIKISLRERVLEKDFTLAGWAKRGLLYQLRCFAGYYRKAREIKKALTIYKKYFRYHLMSCNKIADDL